MALTTSPTTPASNATHRNGFGGASTVWPALSSSRITPPNPDASANAPWTKTTVGPGIGFSSGLERWAQRRYGTGPARSGPGVHRPAPNRLFCAALLARRNGRPGFRPRSGPARSELAKCRHRHAPLGCGGHSRSGAWIRGGGDEKPPERPVLTITEVLGLADHMAARRFRGVSLAATFARLRCG